MDSDTFEIVDIGRAWHDRCLVKTCVCRNPVHKMRMTEEDAKLRGLEALWKKDEDGGFVWEVTRVIVNPSEIVIKQPRAGKKPEVITEKTMIVRCLDCGKADEIFIGGAESRLIQISRI
jgi:hypothetical protein